MTADASANQVIQQVVEVIRKADATPTFDKYNDGLASREDILKFFRDNDELAEYENEVKKELLPQRKKEFLALKDFGKSKKIQWNKIFIEGFYYGASPYHFEGFVYYSVNDKYFKVNFGGYIREGKSYLAGIQRFSDVTVQEMQEFYKNKNRNFIRN